MEILDGKYILRSFRPGDETGILNLWKTAFKSNMDPDLFKWKYLDNPYSKTMMLCVTDNSEIVTFYGGIPFKFQYNADIVYVVNLMDIMSHPDHRTNRVFEKTAKQFIEHFCTPGNLLHMYGFPGELHYSIGEKILNYKKISSISYFNVLPEELINQKKPSDKMAIEVKKVKTMEGMAKEFDLLWENCKLYYPFSIVRDASFVKWRFFDHPEKQYNVLKFVNSDDDSVVAWAVLMVNELKASIVDLLLPDSQILFMEVINCISEYVIGLDLKAIDTWLPENHFLAGHALFSGFKKVNEPSGIIPTVALYEHSPSLEWIKSNLYYNMGDGDLF
jgi:hypothetical protein